MMTGPGSRDGHPRRLSAEAEAVDLDAAYWTADPGGQWVVGVMIASVDGGTAVDGRSAGLGNPADSELFAVLRAHADVVLVGAGTARTEGYAGDRPDDRMRAVRRARGLADVPRIAVVTASAQLDPLSGLFTDTAATPLVLTCATAPADRRAALADRAEVIVAGDDTVDPGAALDALADRGLLRVACEGGPSLLGQVAASGRLDELSLTVAPVLLGGSAHRVLTGPVLAPSQRLELLSALTVDDYLYLRYRVRR